MLTCNVIGGLGNQLFIIFATISCSIDNKNPFAFSDIKISLNRPLYWSNLLCQLRPFIRTSFPQMTGLYEPEFRYNQLKLKSINVCLQGYFQSHKYFENNFASIYRMLDIDGFKNNIIMESKLNFDNAISMHFRLGDYKPLQHIHPIMNYEYYKNALQIMKDPAVDTVIYFCEDEDVETVSITIDKLKCEFPTIVFVKAPNTFADWQQLIMMSCCKHNIIANSSFSWWGAYLNSNANKIVCYPSKWFGPGLKHDTSDLCPEDWIKIEV
jgi:hypothetical protein